MRLIKINKQTVKRFLRNIERQKHMICYIYFHFKTDVDRIMLDVAQTRYQGDSFGINSRGTGYLDNIDFEYNDPEQIILTRIHSFIECKNPTIKRSNYGNN